MSTTMAEAPVRAVVIREDRDTLVVQATPEDVRRFSPAQELLMRALSSGPPPPAHVLLSEPLYDRWGRAVAMVTDVQVSYDQLDVTTFGDVQARYAPGAMRVHLRAVGLPEVFR